MSSKHFRKERGWRSNARAGPVEKLLTEHGLISAAKYFDAAHVIAELQVPNQELRPFIERTNGVVNFYVVKANRHPMGACISIILISTESDCGSLSHPSSPSETK